MSLFTGLIAFPPTPADGDGRLVDDALAMLIDRLSAAKVDAIGLLGSTGTYAYLDNPTRMRALAVALEAARGRVPIIAGVGALRTSWACELAIDAERQGAGGVFMAPMSYAPLTTDEVALHYRTVAGAADLPLAIYNNPGTTQFVFSDDLLVELAAVPTITGVKMPPLANHAYKDELSRLGARTSPSFRIGYSGDWEAADALSAGASAWYSVVAGVLPDPAIRLTRAAQTGDREEADRINARFGRLWNLFKTYGSIRVLSEIGEQVGLPVGPPPRPLARVEGTAKEQVAAALHDLATLDS